MQRLKVLQSTSRTRRILTLSMAVLLSLFALLSPTSEALATSDKQVGIWFNTWYTNEGHYNWSDGNGAGSQKQLLGDVNGDGKDDAVYYFDTGSLLGKWYVATSNGGSFNGPSVWAAGHGSGSQQQFLADVNGDGKDDAVVYFNTGSLLGNWYVALSNGTYFQAPTLWASGHGSGSQSQLLADVNGDGKADAVAYFDVPGFAGKWYVALSNGNAFNGAALWADGHGAGSKKQFLADVTGDGKADAVAFFDVSGFAGKWYVAPSLGTAFGGASQWTDGYGAGSNQQLVADVTGDGKADAVVYFKNQTSTIPPGAWYKADANNSGNGFTGSQLWKYAHGNYVLTDASTAQFLADVTGDNRADPVAFVGSRGLWRVLPANQYTEPPELNIWDAWDIRYRPIVNGTPSVYDSGNSAVIDEQLNKIEDAGIDYILLEMTNGVHQTFTYPRAKAVCERVAAHNAAGGNLKFAVATGNVQGTHNPQTVEDEATQVQNDFVDDPICGSSYYNYKSKPLYVAYGTYADIYGSNGWLNYANKTTTNNFTVIPSIDKFAVNVTNYPSKTGGGCGTIPSNLTNTPPPSEYGKFLAWGMPYGAVGTGPIMSVMPGWINKVGERILRTQLGVEGGFYTTCGWNRVLAAAPEMTVINSFNEFAERTAIEPADTSMIGDSQETWSSPTFYWDLTKQKIQQLKGL
jgi:hypothetical protein